MAAMAASIPAYVCFSLLLALCWAMVEAATTSSCSSIGSKIVSFDLQVTVSYAAPDGFERSIYLVNGQSPGPLLNAQQGETFAVNVTNNLPVQIGMHWHGLHQRGTPEYDGVPGVNQYAIPPGASMIYCFGTESNYGAYWYHVHLRDIYQDGIRGPILIQPNDEIARPYDKISNLEVDVTSMYRAEQASTMLVVNDWFHETSEAINLRLAATNDSMQPLCANSVLFNGMGRVQCPPPLSNSNSFGCAQMSAGMDMGGMGGDDGSMSMSMAMYTGTIVSKIASSSAVGSQRSMITSSMPAEPTLYSATKSCQNTSTPQYVLALAGNTTWHMLHLINAGAAQQLAISIDEHDLWVVSADGAFVQPQKVQVVDIGIGQRYGIIIRKPDSLRSEYMIRASTMTHQTYQGSAVLRYSGPDGRNIETSETTSVPYIIMDGSLLDSSASRLDESALQPYPPEEMPKATREIRLMVNQSDPTVWVLQTGHPFSSNNGQQTPLLFEPRNASGVFWLDEGDVIDVVLQIVPCSLDTMAHPIHLHGHYFRVLGSATNSTFPTGTTVSEVAAHGGMGGRTDFKINVSATAPRRDSAHLPEAGWLALRFAAGNPGVWLLHCHINSHLASGMAVAFVELQNEFSNLAKNVTSPPTIAPLNPIPPLA